MKHTSMDTSEWNLQVPVRVYLDTTYDIAYVEYVEAGRTVTLPRAQLNAFLRVLSTPIWQ